MARRTVKDGPLDDPSKATGRLKNMRIPLVSVVDVPANLVPFLVMKGQEMADGNLLLNAETKEALRGLFGSVAQMAGDLLSAVDNAADSTEAANEVPAEIMGGIASMLSMLEGASAPAPPEGAAAPDAGKQDGGGTQAPTQMSADAKKATRTACEQAIAALKEATNALGSEDEAAGAEMTKHLGLAKAALKAVAKAEAAPVVAPATPAAPVVAPVVPDPAPVAKAGRVISKITEDAIANAVAALQSVLERSRKSAATKEAKAAPAADPIAKSLADKDEQIAVLKARAEAAESEAVALRKARAMPQAAPVGGAQAPAAPAAPLPLNDRIQQAAKASHISRVR